MGWVRRGWLDCHQADVFQSQRGELGTRTQSWLCFTLLFSISLNATSYFKTVTLSYKASHCVAFYISSTQQLDFRRLHDMRAKYMRYNSLLF